mgnify:CR=1 FL=1
MISTQMCFCGPSRTDVLLEGLGGLPAIDEKVVRVMFSDLILGVVFESEGLSKTLQ